MLSPRTKAITLLLVSASALAAQQVGEDTVVMNDNPPSIEDTDHRAAGVVDEATRVSALVQFHVAEYTAMMNNVAIWKTLQYAFWPIVFGAWLLFAQLSDKIPRYLVAWLIALTLPIGYVAYEAAAIDALHGVLLIERDLRPRAAELVKTDQFWLHEREYRGSRSGWLKLAYAAWPPVVCFALALAVLRYRYTAGLSWRDWAGFLICCCIVVLVGLLTWEEKRLNREIDAALVVGDST